MTAPVCILTPNLTRSAGGVIAAILGQARGLGDNGRPVRLVGLGEPEDIAGLPNEQHTKVVPYLHSRTFGPAPGLQAAIDASGANIVHLHGLWIRSVSVAARRWKTSQAKHLVLSPHGMLDPWALANSHWKKRLALTAFEWKTLKAADCLHALNAAELNAIRAMGLTCPVAVIPNGVDLPNLSAPPPLPNGDGRRVMLFLGRLHAKKGITETLKAWAHAIAERPALAREWRIVIAGWDDGGHQAELASLCEALELQKHVAFPGPVYGAGKARMLAHCDAFVLASYSEGLPMSVLEAWSYCKPVFMTRACNLPEGFFASAAVEINTDPHQIAQTFLDRLHSKELEGLAMNGRQLVETQFSWTTVGEKLDALYRWLETGENRPAEVEI